MRSVEEWQRAAAASQRRSEERRDRPVRRIGATMFVAVFLVAVIATLLLLAFLDRGLT